LTLTVYVPDVQDVVPPAVKAVLYAPFVELTETDS
jgi:hypothetical protein